MNLIVCSQDCNHQEDGYCMMLNGATQLSGNRDVKCGYYKNRNSYSAPAKKAPANSPEDFKGFR
jgi:hypothetical protein